MNNLHVRSAGSILNRLNTVPGVATIASVTALALYLPTMCPTFSFFDKGELAASAITLGVPHPTGYPTFMMMGWAASKILFFLRPIVAVNLLAAVLVAAATGLLVALFDYLLARITDAKALSPALRRLCAACAALMTALSGTWWQVANGFEVYSLHTLMLALTTLLFLRYVDAEADKIAAGDTRAGFTWRGAWFALALGLSFSNHLTTGLLAPGFILYYFMRLGFNLRAVKRWVWLAPWFLAGLLPYLYLPLRSMSGAVINHTMPDTPARFWYHVTGMGFNDRMFASFRTFSQQIRYFANILPLQAGYAGLVLAGLGLWQAFRHNLRLALLLLLILLCTVGFACNYAITDIDSYFLGAVFAIGAFAAVGIAWMCRRFGSAAGLAAGLLAVALNIGLNYGPSDEHDNTMVEDLARNMIQPLPPNALLFTSHWAYWHAGSYYLQYVEHVRPDVVIIDPGFMTLTWYVRQLRRNNPQLMDLIKPEADRFLAESEKGRNRPGDTLTAGESDAYDAMVRALRDRAVQVRPVYATADVLGLIGAGYGRRPEHLAFRITSDTAYVPQPFRPMPFHMWKRRVDPFALTILEIYARSQMSRAEYEQAHGDQQAAAQYAADAQRYDPHMELSDVPDLPLDDERRAWSVIRYFNKMRNSP